jgi:hypothetical protein
MVARLLASYVFGVNRQRKYCRGTSKRFLSVAETSTGTEAMGVLPTEQMFLKQV